MNKIEELFANDFERTSIAKIHRILSNSPLASLCPSIYRFIHFIENLLPNCKSTIPAHLWLFTHMEEFIQLRTTTETHPTEPINDLLQLMIEAFHSNKVHLNSLVFLFESIDRFFFHLEFIFIERIIE